MTAIEPAPSLHLALLNPAGRPHMGKWPAGATAESLAQADHLPTAAATQVVTVASPGRGLRDATPT